MNLIKVKLPIIFRNKNMKYQNRKINDIFINPVSENIRQKYIIERLKQQLQNKIKQRSKKIKKFSHVINLKIFFSGSELIYIADTSLRYIPKQITYIIIIILRIIMQQGQINSIIQKATQSVYKSKYILNQSWTDSITEFKSFSDRIKNQSCYFKIIKLPSEYRYIQESHQRINILLNTLILNIEVNIVQREFSKTLYLLKNEKNSITFQKYVHIKRENSEQIDQRFILKVLNFFLEIIPILSNQRINTDLNLLTICIQQEEIKLSDYQIFFHPKNMKTNLSNDLQQKYINQAKILIYQLLTLNKNKIDFISQNDVNNTLKNMNTKDSKNYSEQFIKIVETLFQNGYIPKKLLNQQCKRIIYQFGEYRQQILTDSYISIKDSFNQSITTELGSVKQIVTKPINKRKISKKRLCLLALFIFIIVAVMCFMISKFLLQDVECKANEFKVDRKCLPCSKGCVGCVSDSSNSCTKCWGQYWLVVLNSSQQSGSCSQRCIGIQFEGRKCIISPNNKN